MKSAIHKVRCGAILAATLCAASCSHSDAQREISPGWKSVPHVANTDPDREQLELELREFIFRREIASPIRNEIVFLSFGYADDGNWIEPPYEYIDRFSDLPVMVGSVSDANLFSGGLTSKAFGRAGHIYYVQIVEWLDDSTVKVNHSLYGGPLYGGGATGEVYDIQQGKWRLKVRGQHYIE